MTWELRNKKLILETIPFKVEELDLRDTRNDRILKYHRLDAPDWVNIVAVTEELEVVLISQERAGTLTQCLEIPGGVVDQTDTNSAEAASRELEEETGYRPGKLQFLTTINPNPAIMTNNLHMYLASEIFIPQKRAYFPDDNENITIKLVPFSEALNYVRDGKIHSALAALTLLLAQAHLNGSKP